MMLNKIPRRSFFSALAALSPLAWLGLRRPKPDNSDVRVKRMYETKEFYRTKADYFEDRAGTAENDADYWQGRADTAEKAIDKAMSELGVPGYGSPTPVGNTWCILHNAANHRNTHPDCLKETA